MESKVVTFMIWWMICLCHFASHSSACNCLVDHPQTKLCRAHFVVKGQIVERKRVESNDTSLPASFRFLLGYKVQVLETYKGQAHVDRENEFWIHTPDAGGLCGVSGMWTNGTYLMSGRFLMGMNYMAYCDLWSDWDKLTQEQIAGLESVYGQNCRCRVRGVMGMVKVAEQDLSKMAYLDKSPLWDDETCRYNPVASYYYKTQDCETLYSHCSMTGGKCSWDSTPDYQSCYQAREAVWRHKNTIKGSPGYRRRPRCKKTAVKFVKLCARAKKRREEKKRRLAEEGKIA